MIIAVFKDKESLKNGKYWYAEQPLDNEDDIKEHLNEKEGTFDELFD